MGCRMGAVLRSDCGAVLFFLRSCPDPPEECVRCACGAEMVPVPDREVESLLEQLADRTRESA